ncbi:MAG: septum formation inhibitor Maf [Pseudomonadales bacterium]|nr:septum formation inhibitor Maf [Pseudomonadales bacterium]
MSAELENNARVDCYLASSSPRRKALLEQIGVRFSVIPAAVDESSGIDEDVVAFVSRLAQEKARAGWQLAVDTFGKENSLPVIGADTCGELDGRILVKPENRQNAVEMLTLMSGREHRVFSAVSIYDGIKQETLVSETRVFFRQLSAREIEKYCATKEPIDKAGSYAIQGKGAVFVNRIEGSYSGVVGLPLAETSQLLSLFAVPIWVT